MAVPDLKTALDRPRSRFVAIQQKLERLLRSKNKKIEPFEAEVVSIIDAIDALNRDAYVLTKRAHRGDSDRD